MRLYTKKFCEILLILILPMFIAPTLSSADTLTKFTDLGLLSNGTRVFVSEDLRGGGSELANQTSSIGSVKITDDINDQGGAPGAFSGFDLDAIFFLETMQHHLTITDVPTNLHPAGNGILKHDPIFFRPVPGVFRDTTNPKFTYDLINAARSLNDPVLGPLWGHDNSADGLQPEAFNALLTLGEGSSIADINLLPLGDISLGEGGSLTANFSDIPVPSSVGNSLFLVIGEVGAPEKFQGATVEVDKAPIPEPSTVTLLLSGLLVLGMHQWKNSRKEKS